MTQRLVSGMLRPVGTKAVPAGIGVPNMRRSAAIEPFEAAFLWLIAKGGQILPPLLSHLTGKTAGLFGGPFPHSGTPTRSLPTTDWRR